MLIPQPGLTVNVLKTEKYRYWLTYLLEDLPAGANFSPSDLHMTVIPWFVVDDEVEENLPALFKSEFSNVDSFIVRIGADVSLGPRDDISVLLIEGNPKVYDLHNKAFAWFESINGRWAVKNPYVGEEYKPHIRRRKQTWLRQGDKLNINSLVLVKALRRTDDFRLVEGKVLFNE